jgi:hypothetical protein
MSYTFESLFAERLRGFIRQKTRLVSHTRNRHAYYPVLTNFVSTASLTKQI